MPGDEGGTAWRRELSPTTLICHIHRPPPHTLASASRWGISCLHANIVCGLFFAHPQRVSGPDLAIREPGGPGDLGRTGQSAAIPTIMACPGVPRIPGRPRTMQRVVVWRTSRCGFGRQMSRSTDPPNPMPDRYFSRFWAYRVHGLTPTSRPPAAVDIFDPHPPISRNRRTSWGAESPGSHGPPCLPGPLESHGSHGPPRLPGTQGCRCRPAPL